MIFRKFDGLGVDLIKRKTLKACRFWFLVLIVEYVV